MGRWSGLSNLIDFHFEHGHGSYRSGKSSMNLTTRYHKLDDSIFVLCRNCGQSTKNEEQKKVEEDCLTQSKIKSNPRHFLTWSAAAANNRIQKMGKTFANNITKFQLKVEKAIPFQQAIAGGGSDNFVKTNECCNHGFEDQENNNSNNSLSTSPDIVKVHNLQTTTPQNNISCCSSNSNNNLSTNSSSDSSTSFNSEANLLNKVVQQLGELNRYQYESRIQNARIVQSHPSVSQKHSQGSVANPDKILQINIESYNVYSPNNLSSITGNLNQLEKSNKNFQLVNVDVETNEDICKRLDIPSDFLYDSGTGSANTSISGSSVSSVVTTLPVKNLSWSRGSCVSASESNLNSSSPSVVTHQQQQQSRGQENNRNKNKKSNTLDSDNKMTVKVSESVVSKRKDKDSSSSIIMNDSNSTNSSSGVPITESTDETSLLIDNNKSNHKRGLRSSSGKSVEICNNNNKNSVPTTVENSQNPHLEKPISTSTPLKIQSLISQAYPPSKLAVTIFEEEGELRHAPWFQAGIPREIALEVLRNESIGSFIVRESTTKSGCFALSLRVPKDHQPSGIAHYLILKTSRGYKIKGFTKEFSSLSSLITHHSVMSELLPCPLSLHQYFPKQALRVSRANSSDFMEPEKLIIGTFTDF